MYNFKKKYFERFMNKGVFMHINTIIGITSYIENSTGLKEDVKDKIKNAEISGKVLSQSYLAEYNEKIKNKSSQNIQIQSTLFDLNKLNKILHSIDFKAIGYNGKAINQLTPNEAKELVSDDGFFGISKTSIRLSEFVLNSGGNNLAKIKVGREGIILGFKQAEQLWGQKLPEISYQTLEKTLSKIDEKISSLGGNIVNTTI